MGSQLFKAQMAVGSWVNTPLMPDLQVPTEIVASYAQSEGKQGTSGKAKATDTNVVMID
jgi:hypothetical protein